MPRSCDECSACCTVLEVPELGLSEGQGCQHQCADGCGVYMGRPKVCREYECTWLVGMGPDDERPDALGIVFSVTADETYGVMLMASEVWPGASEGGRALDRILSIARSGGMVGVWRGAELVRVHFPDLGESVDAFKAQNDGNPPPSIWNNPEAKS